MSKVTCVICGKEFDKLPAQIKTRPTHYCSKECFHKRGSSKKEIVACDNCGRQITRFQSRNEGEHNYCSRKCYYEGSIKKQKLTCSYCEKLVERIPCRLKLNKSSKVFCDKSCAAKYKLENKILRCKNRPKIEVYLEEQLTAKYSHLAIEFNNRSILNGLELDIYVPSLNLGIELNGPTHYFPIYGEDQLDKRQTNDLIKLQRCLDQGISLHIIDISLIKRYTKGEKEQILHEIELLLL